MSLNHSPKIVTDGLVLCLDAASRKSYPGSGTTWFDRSGNGNHGTLTNGPTFNSSNGGSIAFDGVDDFVLGSSNLPFSGDANFSILYYGIWDSVNFSNNYPSAVGTNFVNVVNRGLSTTWSQGRVALDFWNYRFRDNNALNVQTWYYLAFTKTSGLINSTSKIYVNGTLRTGAVENGNGPPDLTSSPYVIGRLDDTRIFNGRVSNVQIYNRALSQSEIQQNFNATRGRFGI